MMISGSSSLYTSMYTNKPYSSVSISTSEDTETQSAEGTGRPDGPPPPPPPPSSGVSGSNSQEGPNLDTDSDGYWSEDELSDFSSVAEEYGISLDVSDIMSTYDTDGDNKISEDERISLAQDNALQMPSPQELMESMPSRPPMNMDSEETESTSASDIFSQYIAEYAELNNYEMNVASLFEANA